MNRAVFLDRDGVINELVYHQEQEVIDSPFTPGQFKLILGVIEALKSLRQAGYLAILVSNQPGIAKGHMTLNNFRLIRQKMNTELIADGAELDGEYYCLHHPKAVAARENDINLKESWVIGDNLSDIQAGKTAGCRTILIGTMKCELCHIMGEKNVFPDKIFTNVGDAVRNHILLKEYVVSLPETL